jgi:hypothetical protein
MQSIDTTERDAILEEVHHRLTAAKQAILEEVTGRFHGRKIVISRTLKDPTAGEKGLALLESTVVGVQFTYDDEMEFVVDYTHPHTGVVVRTTAPI